jgi:hypothetical protein
MPAQPLSGWGATPLATQLSWPQEGLKPIAGPEP